MSLPRSTYYYRPRVPAAETQKKAADLRDRIEAIVEEFPRYGYRRVTAQLRREGFVVNHNPALRDRIMREESLQCQVRRRFAVTTDSAHGLVVYPNLIRNPAISGVSPINQVWVADITYIRLLTPPLAGFLYLAAPLAPLMDLFSRKAIGWALSDRIDTELTLAALSMALEERKPPAGCIHHSDQGVQYAAGDYVATLEKAGMRISMARKGDPYDNAAVESFIRTLKQEEVYLWEYRDRRDAIKRIPYFLEEVYPAFGGAFGPRLPASLRGGRRD